MLEFHMGLFFQEVQYSTIVHSCSGLPFWKCPFFTESGVGAGVRWEVFGLTLHFTIANTYHFGKR